MALQDFSKFSKMPRVVPSGSFVARAFTKLADVISVGSRNQQSSTFFQIVKAQRWSQKGKFVGGMRMEVEHFSLLRVCRQLHMFAQHESKTVVYIGRIILIELYTHVRMTSSSVYMRIEQFMRLGSL